MFSKKNYNTTIYGWLKSHDFYSSHNQVLTSLKTHQVPRKTCQNPIKNLPKRHDTPVFLASQNIKIQKKTHHPKTQKPSKTSWKKPSTPSPTGSEALCLRQPGKLRLAQLAPSKLRHLCGLGHRLPRRRVVRLMTRWRRIAGRRRGLAMDFMIECLWLLMVNDG